jgi:hypothetical protein
MMAMNCRLEKTHAIVKSFKIWNRLSFKMAQSMRGSSFSILFTFSEWQKYSLNWTPSEKHSVSLQSRKIPGPPCASSAISCIFSFLRKFLCALHYEHDVLSVFRSGRCGVNWKFFDPGDAELMIGNGSNDDRHARTNYQIWHTLEWAIGFEFARVTLIVYARVIVEGPGIIRIKLVSIEVRWDFFKCDRNLFECIFSKV